jgi:YfiR/HmsC-like
MNNFSKVFTIVIAIVTLFLCNNLFAQTKTASPEIIAEMILKLASFEKSMSGASDDITVYVLGADDVAKALDKKIGEKIGKATLKKVKKGDDLPEESPNIFYIGDETKIFSAIMFTRTQKALSVTGLLNQAEKGISLSIASDDAGKPAIAVNLAASKEEGLDWNPAILKIAMVIK